MFFNTVALGMSLGAKEIVDVEPETQPELSTPRSYYCHRGSWEICLTQLITLYYCETRVAIHLAKDGGLAGPPTFFLQLSTPWTPTIFLPYTLQYGPITLITPPGSR